MDERVAIWNLLHDGEITAVQSRQECFILFVNIPYLRRRLQPLGDSIILELHQPTRVSFEHFDGEFEPLEDVLELGRLDILGTESNGMPVVIDTSLGRLTLAFERLELALDTADSIQFDTLDRVATEYWTEWEQKAKAARDSA